MLIINIFYLCSLVGGLSIHIRFYIKVSSAFESLV